MYKFKWYADLFNNMYVHIALSRLYQCDLMFSYGKLKKDSIHLDCSSFLDTFGEAMTFSYTYVYVFSGHTKAAEEIIHAHKGP